MRKIIGETLGWTGLALLGAGFLYGVFNTAMHVLPFMWRVALSGDLGAIAWMAAVVGFILMAVGVTVHPSEKKKAAA